MPYRYQRRNKFNAVKQKYESIQGFTRTYDSKKEASYAMELDWRIKAGEVKSWTPQHKFELYVNDEKICNYYIDFKVELSNGDFEYVEVKGFETDLWRYKWRLTKALKDELTEPNSKLVLVK